MSGMNLDFARRIYHRLFRSHTTPVTRSKDEPKRYVAFDVRNAPQEAPGVLLCYLVDPFLAENAQPATVHANYWRTQAIADVFHDYGYRVDVCDWRKADPPTASDYEIVIGLGVAFCESLSKSRPKQTVIYLGTGTHAEQTNDAYRLRLNEIQQSRGVKLRERSLPNDIGPTLADSIFVVGNEWVDSTYRTRGEAPTFRLWNSMIDGVQQTTSGKDWESARQHFLWMAGYGPVRRRLDVLLEVFAANPAYHLWVCGSVESEKDFFAAYKRELTELPNIHYQGFTDVGSDAFADITKTCGFLLYPSTSDGMPGSVVNSAAAGLVPIITKETGIDLDGFPIDINDASSVEISQLIRHVSEMPPEELKSRAEAVAAFVRKTYTREHFLESFRAALNAVGIGQSQRSNG